MPEINPVAKLARARRARCLSGAARPEAPRSAARYAREGELEDFLAALVRSQSRASRMPRAARPTCPARRRCRRTSATGSRRSNSCSGRSAAARICATISAMDFAQIGRARHRCLLPPGLRRAAGEARAKALPVRACRRRSRGSTLGRAAASKSRPPKGRIARARRHRHGLDQRADRAARSSSRPICPSASSMPASKLTLGSYDRIALELPGNPLGLQRDDLVFEKANNDRTAALLANVGGSPLCFRRCRRHVRPRACRAQGRGAMTAFALEWLTRLLRRRRREGGQAQPCDALERRSPARSARSRRRRVGGQPSRRMLMEPLRERIFFAGEAVHETLVGHGRRRLGIRRARGGRGACGCSASAPKPQPKRRSGRKRQRRSSDDAKAEGADRLVERQGQRLGAARSSPRRRVRDRRRAHHGHRYLRARQHAWCARGIAARATRRGRACRRSSCASRFPVRTRSTSARWRRRWRRRKRDGVTHVIFGDLFLADVRAYREAEARGRSA